MNAVTIDSVSVGTIVRGVTTHEYSRVKKCVHGKKYYAFFDDDDEVADIDPVTWVTDDDTHMLDCCN